MTHEKAKTLPYNKYHKVIETSDKVFIIIDTRTGKVKEHYHGSFREDVKTVESALIDYDRG